MDGRWIPYFLSRTSKMPIRMGHFTLNFSLASIGCLCGNHRNQTIWKHEGFPSQDCGGFSEGEGRGGSPHVMAVGFQPDTRRLIRASLIATPLWSISEALPQLSQRRASCSPMTSPLWTSTLPTVGLTNPTHTRLRVFMCGRIEGRWVKRGAHMLCVMSRGYPFGSWMLSHVTANAMETKAWQRILL